MHHLCDGFCVKFHENKSEIIIDIVCFTVFVTLLHNWFLSHLRDGVICAHWCWRVFFLTRSLKKIQNLSKKIVRRIAHIKHKPFSKIIVFLHLELTIYLYLICLHILWTGIFVDGIACLCPKKGVKQHIVKIKIIVKIKFNQIIWLF